MPRFCSPAEGGTVNRKPIKNNPYEFETRPNCASGTLSKVQEQVALIFALIGEVAKDFLYLSFLYCADMAAISSVID